MMELESMRVKKYALKVFKRFSQERQPKSAATIASVELVSHDRMPLVGQMNSYLMGSACFYSNSKQGPRAVFPFHCVMSNSIAAAAGVYGHLLTVLRIASQRQVNSSRRRRGPSVDQGQIFFADSSALELP